MRSFLILLVLLMPFACSKQSVTARLFQNQGSATSAEGAGVASQDDGQQEALAPIAATTTNLCSYDLCVNRCAAKSVARSVGPDRDRDRYSITCEAKKIGANGDEEIVTGYEDSIIPSWVEPRTSSSYSFSVVGCTKSKKMVRQTCIVEVLKTAQDMKVFTDLKLTKVTPSTSVPAIVSKIETDEVDLPYYIRVYGLVNEVPRLFVPNAGDGGSSLGLTDSTSEGGEVSRFIPGEISAFEIPTPDISKSCAIGERYFHLVDRFVLRTLNDRSKIIAGDARPVLPWESAADGIFKFLRFLQCLPDAMIIMANDKSIWQVDGSEKLTQILKNVPTSLFAHSQSRFAFSRDRTLYLAHAEGSLVSTQYSLKKVKADGSVQTLYVNSSGATGEQVLNRVAAIGVNDSEAPSLVYVVDYALYNGAPRLLRLNVDGTLSVMWTFVGSSITNTSIDFGQEGNQRQIFVTIGGTTFRVPGAGGTATPLSSRTIEATRPDGSKQTVYFAPYLKLENGDDFGSYGNLVLRGRSGNWKIVAGDLRVASDFVGIKEAAQLKLATTRGLNIALNGDVMVRDSDLIRVGNGHQRVNVLGKPPELSSEGTPSWNLGISTSEYSFLGFAADGSLVFGRRRQDPVSQNWGQEIAVLRPDSTQLSVISPLNQNLIGPSFIETLAQDPQGRFVYAANSTQPYLRKINPDGSVVNLAGHGAQYGPYEGAYQEVGVMDVRGMVYDKQGNLFVASGAFERTGVPTCCVRKFGTDGRVTVIAGNLQGNGKDFYDGIPAKEMNLVPSGMASAIALLPDRSLLVNAGYAVFILKPDTNSSGEEFYRAYRFFGATSESTKCGSGVVYAKDTNELLLGGMPKVCAASIRSVAAQSECDANGNFKVAIGQSVYSSLVEGTSQVVVMSLGCKMLGPASVP